MAKSKSRHGTKSEVSSHAMKCGSTAIFDSERAALSIFFFFLRALGVHRYDGGEQRLTEKRFNLLWPTARRGWRQKKTSVWFNQRKYHRRRAGMKVSLVRVEKRPTAASFVENRRNDTPYNFLSFRID